MSVWQEWLISLAHVFPQNEEEQEVTELVYELFGILLYHAIRLEYGKFSLHIQLTVNIYRRLEGLGRYLGNCTLENLTGTSTTSQPTKTAKCRSLKDDRRPAGSSSDRSEYQSTKYKTQTKSQQCTVSNARICLVADPHPIVGRFTDLH